MTAKLVFKYVSIADLVCCIALVCLLLRKKQLSDFNFFGIFLFCRIFANGLSIPLLFFRSWTGLSKNGAYWVYIYIYWIFFAAQAVLQTLAIYGIYRLAMRPLPGLQRVGQIIFRWVAGVSFGLSVFYTIGPHSTDAYWAVATTQIHQGVSVLSLCLLLFVCLAIRPLGLTFRSHLFGVSLGLGVTSAITLIESAWVTTAGGHQLYSPVYIISGAASLAAVVIWLVYFALPEPERRMVLLPTTSPFFMWNSISEALGDDPGFVAVAGFTPDMLDPAEIEELSRSAHHDELPEDTDSDDSDSGDSGGPPSPHSLMQSFLTS